MEELHKRLTSLLSVKSIVTLAMTMAMIGMLFFEIVPDSELRSVFCTAYGAVMTYYFTRKEG